MELSYPEREKLNATVESDAAERAHLLIRGALLGRKAQELAWLEMVKLSPRAIVWSVWLERTERWRWQWAV